MFKAYEGNINQTWEAKTHFKTDYNIRNEMSMTELRELLFEIRTTGGLDEVTKSILRSIAKSVATDDNELRDLHTEIDLYKPKEIEIIE